MNRYLICSAIILFAGAIDLDSSKMAATSINNSAEVEQSSEPNSMGLGSFTSPVPLFICTVLSLFFYMLGN
ncbi:hypothetical protein XELAEV_18015058mg [Xenopus laevis]|uniref:Uncharacterized protein n=1 Tax=Xenopus laevis TaxID=8355 RepID=A0A974DHT4_XENLA|nr:hypothetical protein XELAEV_18015058mg [Xenopus laevis]